MYLKDIKIGIDKIEKGSDVGKFLDDMQGLDKEIMVLFGFDMECHYLLARNIVKYSEQSNASFDMNEMFNLLKEYKCKGFILVHNHPSGLCIPTQIDVDTTKDIMKEAKKRKLIFVEHYTWSNGFLWGIINMSIKNDICIKPGDVH